MYGLIHLAIKDLVVSHAGEKAWSLACADAGCEDSFVMWANSSDDITYALLQSGSRRLQVSPAIAARDLGRRFVGFLARQGFEGLLETLGTSLLEALRRLDTMHGQAQLIFPELQTPSFKCEAATDSSFTLHYYTRRQADLLDLVIGLVEGLAERYATQIQVTPLVTRRNGGQHDILRIDLL